MAQEGAELGQLEMLQKAQKAASKAPTREEVTKQMVRDAMRQYQEVKAMVAQAEPEKKTEKPFPLAEVGIIVCLGLLFNMTVILMLVIARKRKAKPPAR